MKQLRSFVFVLATLTVPCFAAPATRPDKPTGDEAVVSEDYNLDGHQDFSILKSSGAHGEFAEFWLWNPTTQLFERNDYLSRDMNVEVDKEQKLIWTHGASSIYDSTTNEYLLDHGKVVWVLSIEQHKTRSMSAGAFPVIRKFKIPVNNHMQTVLKLIYTDDDQFKKSCDRCQVPEDLLGCELLGYGKVIGRINVGTEVIAFDAPQKESVCAYYPTVSGHPLRILPKSNVNLKGQ